MSFEKRRFMPTTNKQAGLPVSQPDSNSETKTLRRRLSSLSLNLQPSFSSPDAASWGFRRSQSVYSMGEYAGTSLRKWWDWSWTWILTAKPTFASDLEMNEEETAVLGCQSKGSWRHVFYKVRSELRRLMGSDNVGLPQTYRYESLKTRRSF